MSNRNEIAVIAGDAENGKLISAEDQAKLLAFLYNENKRNSKEIASFKEEYNTDKQNATISMAEAHQLDQRIKAKGIELMGGKKSGSYHDIPLRTKVFRKIRRLVKEEYDLYDASTGRQLSYKYLKHKDFKGAMKIVDTADLGTALWDEVIEANENYVG